jgi:hypothetical protein
MELSISQAVSQAPRNEKGRHQKHINQRNSKPQRAVTLKDAVFVLNDEARLNIGRKRPILSELNAESRQLPVA